MSYVVVAPEMLTAAAGDLDTIGSDLSMARTAAAVPTINLVPAAGDEVSAGIAHLFSRYAEDFHGLAGKAAASHEQFAQHLKTGAAWYTGIEKFHTTLLRAVYSFQEHYFGPWLNSLPPQLQQLVWQINQFLHNTGDALFAIFVGIPVIIGIIVLLVLAEYFAYL
ncbi:PE family protein [Mycobacterium conspicuum]|uniref:Uncharacterized protein n=1 Tax=Mycobacterium conspicuum TaxID=44010 RepID=A0A1X1TBD8_9MYCO|nr:PE family protein [Mycobacterium conspicuum]ORV41890.1 hypothetical protein AWC00_13995 [Mycobacterium conspicuum]BBZ40815.1 hypothetical protein MCNS_38780 [Mycobacterium conspicuum]